MWEQRRLEFGSMPAPHAMVAFTLASVVLILIPGPSVLFVIGRSLAFGRRGGLMSVCGNELGALPLVAAVAFGFGSIVAGSIAVFTVVKLLGAAYLVYLGVQAIRHRGDDASNEDKRPVQSVSSFTLLLQGFVVGVSNPKTIVFFIAALPQFVDFHSGAVPAQMMVLGAIFTVIALVCDSLWAILAGAARTWFARSPRRLRAVRATGGGMMIALGGTLAVAGHRS